MKPLLGRMVALLLAGACVGGAVCFLRPPTPEWRRAPRIEAASFRPAPGQKVLWVDARSSDDFDSGHIPGAVALRVEQWDDLLPAVVGAWQPGTTVIVYCGMSSCLLSEEVAAKLRADTGWSEIRVLDGDWRAVKGATP